MTNHDGDFYDQFCREVEAERIPGDSPAAAVVGICTRIAHRIQRRMTEQQPEPVAPPLNEDPVAVALGVAEPKNEDVAARAKALTKRVAILRLEKAMREQLEPVSRDELAKVLFESHRTHPLHGDPLLYLADALLSRYTITRKQETDHG